jgi:hypothetical protein
MDLAMVTSSALESADVPIKTKLQVFAGASGTTPLVGILQTRFIAHALQYIRTQNNFSVISYHGRNGRTLTNATLPNGQLKPVNNQTNANYRPTDILFAKVESDIRFETIDPTIAGVFPFSFFIRLENQTIEVLNSTGNAVQLNTFHAPNNWYKAGTQADLDAIWDNPRSVGKPLMLKSPDINDIHAVATIVQYVHK